MYWNWHFHIASIMTMVCPLLAYVNTKDVCYHQISLLACFCFFRNMFRNSLHAWLILLHIADIIIGYLSRKFVYIVPVGVTFKMYLTAISRSLKLSHASGLQTPNFISRSYVFATSHKWLIYSSTNLVLSYSLRHNTSQVSV